MFPEFHLPNAWKISWRIIVQQRPSLISNRYWAHKSTRWVASRDGLNSRLIVSREKNSFFTQRDWSVWLTLCGLYLSHPPLLSIRRISAPLIFRDCLPLFVERGRRRESLTPSHRLVKWLSTLMEFFPDWNHVIPTDTKYPRAHVFTRVSHKFRTPCSVLREVYELSHFA